MVLATILLLIGHRFAAIIYQFASKLYRPRTCPSISTKTQSSVPLSCSASQLHKLQFLAKSVSPDLILLLFLQWMNQNASCTVQVPANGSILQYTKTPIPLKPVEQLRWLHGHLQRHCKRRMTPIGVANR